MKILFATMPFDGHFNPLTGVAMHLKAAGHDVRWYAGPSYAAKLERLGIPHFPFQRATEINQDNIGELFPERAKLRGPALIRFEAQAHLRRATPRTSSKMCGRSTRRSPSTCSSATPPSTR